jgi:hypothetical protein
MRRASRHHHQRMMASPTVKPEQIERPEDSVEQKRNIISMEEFRASQSCAGSHQLRP